VGNKEGRSNGKNGGKMGDHPELAAPGLLGRSGKELNKKKKSKNIN